MSIVDRFFEQFSDWCFVDERAPQNAKYIKHASVKAAIVLCNSHKAIGAYSAVYLYPNSIFGITPKCFDVKLELIPQHKANKLHELLPLNLQL